MIMGDHTHHIMNVVLTSVGSTSAAATFIPGDEFRANCLFILSAICSIVFITINAKHFIKAVKDLFSAEVDDELPPDNPAK